MNAASFLSDISVEAASRAYYGTSFHPEQRAQSERNGYAEQLAQDYADLHEQAVKGGTLDLLAEEFARYREGARRRRLAYLHSSSRCVSSFIAGPSNFPARRMNKRADIAHKRLVEMLDHRAKALSAIKRKLRPDLRAIYAGDSDALERLQQKIIKAEADQSRMKTTNATIRAYAKEGREAQIAALLAMGWTSTIAQTLLQPDFCNRIGFPDYELTNNNANIRRMKARVEQITQLQSTPSANHEGESATVEECPAENRVRLHFPGKPDVEVRSKLKANGFRWTPSLGVWQAYFNSRAVNLAKEIAGATL